VRPQSRRRQRRQPCSCAGASLQPCGAMKGGGRAIRRAGAFSIGQAQANPGGSLGRWDDVGGGEEEVLRQHHAKLSCPCVIVQGPARRPRRRRLRAVPGARRTRIGSIEPVGSFHEGAGQASSQWVAAAWYQAVTRSERELFLYEDTGRDHPVLDICMHRTAGIPHGGEELPRCRESLPPGMSSPWALPPGVPKRTPAWWPGYSESWAWNWR